MSLTIKGEALKAMDETARTPSDLKMRSLVARVECLGEDTLTWTVRTADVTAAATVIPEAGQIVELYEGETRIFRGHAMDPEITPYGVTVTVQGPWWWMTRWNATSTQTDPSGATATRPIVKYEEGSVSDHITTAINAMISAGLPVQLGTIATGFTIPTVQYQVNSWADVIARLMEWLPDAVAWFDYSGTGAPSFNVTRRSGATATTYTVGTHNLILSELRMRAMSELEVARVEIPYIDDTGDLPEFAVQSAGTAANGKLQIVPVSGNELFDIDVLRASVESYEVSATAWSAANIETIALSKDAQFAAAKSHGLTTQLDFAGTSNFIYSYGPTSNGPWNQQTVTVPAAVVTNTDGATISTTGYSILDTNSAPPSWAIDEFGLIEVIISGGFGYQFKDQNYVLSGGNYVFSSSNSAPTWYFDLAMDQKGLGFIQGAHVIMTVGTWSMGAWMIPTANIPAATYLPSSSGSNATKVVSTFNDQWNIGSHNFTASQIVGKQMQVWTGSTWFPVGLIKSLSGNIVTASPTVYGGTRLYRILAGSIGYKPLDYGFLNPPTGLATNLLAASNWKPWEGQITVKHATVPTDQPMGWKFSVSGLVSAAGSAGALPKAVETDYFDRIRRIFLGVPPRLKYSDLVGKVAATPQAALE